MEGFELLLYLAKKNKVVVLNEDGTTTKIIGLVEILTDLKKENDKNEFLSDFIKWYKGD